MPSPESHAFISYVREDSERVDRLQKILEAAGVRVWRDTADLWPGEDWRGRIRQAITRNSLAFIACFSQHSEARSVSGQNEELNLAVAQMRLRRPDQAWLIPVRFDDVELPDIDIGGGRTLNSIQRADLIGPAWDQGAARLVAAVVRTLPQDKSEALPAAPVSIRAQLKAALRDPSGDIALNDLLVALANDVHEAAGGLDYFPDSSGALAGSPVDAALYLVGLVDACVQSLNPALDALVVGSQWAREEQASTLTRFVERLAPRNAGGTGMAVLTSLRWFPLLTLTYTGALAAVHQSNYTALRGITLSARVRDGLDGRVPFVARAHPWRPFGNFELLPQVLAYRASGDGLARELVEGLHEGKRGKRYTPVSDYLHETLREKFRADQPNDAEYSDLFDRTEAFLALLAIDAQTHLQRRGQYYDGAYYGRFTWRERHLDDNGGIASTLAGELADQGERWGPLRVGLFGGLVDRAKGALEIFKTGVAEARRRRW